MLDGSQEGGKGLGRPKTKHEKGVGCFMVHKRVGRVWEGQKRSTKMNLGVSHGSQE